MATKKTPACPVKKALVKTGCPKAISDDPDLGAKLAAKGFSLPQFIALATVYGPQAWDLAKKVIELGGKVWQEVKPSTPPVG